MGGASDHQTAASKHHCEKELASIQLELQWLYMNLDEVVEGVCTPKRHNHQRACEQQLEMLKAQSSVT